MLLPDALHPAPPDPFVIGGQQLQPAYTPYFGDEYLPLAEDTFTEVPFGIELMYWILLAHQRIKYNGLGLIHIFDLTEKVVGDIVSNVNLEIINDPEVSHDVWHYKMTFDINKPALQVNDGWGRMSIWRFFMVTKYPYITIDLTELIG
jgi:hypothetical protein